MIFKNALSEIYYSNKRRKAAGNYLSEDELREVLEEAWPMALRRASLEVFEGRYDESELSRQIVRESIQQEACQLIFNEEAASAR